MKGNDFMSKALGAIPSPFDMRDMTIANFTPVGQEFEESYNILDESLIIRKNQGSIQSCVAHALSEERDITEYLQHNVMQEHSVGFIYANRQGTISDLFDNEGMIPRDALTNLVRYGDTLKEDFPFNDLYSKLKGTLTPELFEKAYPRRPSSYYRVYTENEVKTALKNKECVVAMLPIYPSFYNFGANYVIQVPNVNVETLSGYHQVLFTGWNKNGYRTLNSWGEYWGDKGFCTIPYNFPIREMWAVTDKINRYDEEGKQMYGDFDSVSNWAKESVVKCNELGLMSGDGVNFNPKAPITREEIAAVMYRLYQKLSAK
jgi:hypothetical protein